MPGLEEWKNDWDAGFIPFHWDHVNEVLLNFKDKLLVKNPSRVFVPLCGKTNDMKWLADQGHEVVGVEGVAKACVEFFQDQSLPYTESEVPGIDDATLFQTTDGKIKLYKCDFFKFSRDVAGCFDGVWDRASLVAIDPDQREKYRDIILSVLTPGSRILLETYFYDADERNSKGVPHTVPHDVVKELYGSTCTHEILADDDMLDKAPMLREEGLTWYKQLTHLLIVK